MEREMFPLIREVKIFSSTGSSNITQLGTDFGLSIVKMRFTEPAWLKKIKLKQRGL